MYRDKFLFIFWTFLGILLTFKAIQIGFVVADSNKITDCTGYNLTELNSWLLFSSISGLVICLYTSYKIFNSYIIIISIYPIDNYDNYDIYDTNNNYLNIFLTIVSMIVSTISFIWGFVVCFKYCDDINPYRINVISKMSIFVDMLIFLTICISLQYHKQIKSMVKTSDNSYSFLY
jgi:hypothetical protein